MLAYDDGKEQNARVDVLLEGPSNYFTFIPVFLHSCPRLAEAPGGSATMVLRRHRMVELDTYLRYFAAADEEEGS